MGAIGKCCALIINVLLMFILIPICYFLETTLRPLAVVWVVLRQTNCGSFRQILTLILAIIALPVLFFVFGLWGIIQVIINVCKYFAGPRKYHVTGEGIVEFLWARPQPLYRMVVDIFGAIRGAPLSDAVA